MVHSRGNNHRVSYKYPT